MEDKEQMSLQQAAQEQQDNDPTEVIESRKDDFFKVLPKHIDRDAWLRMAKSAIRKNDDLMSAARRDGGAKMCIALLDCAKKGHMPGGDEYYFVPRKGGIDGQEGWKGIVARILNSGAYQKVVREVVYAGEEFEFDPNVDERPRHKIDHRQRTVGREPEMAYAYAVHLNGTPSAVAIADPRYIAKVRGMSRGSVWGSWDEQQYKKTAIKLLESMVETSSDNRNRLPQAHDIEIEQIEAAREHNRRVEQVFESGLSDPSGTK